MSVRFLLEVIILISYTFLRRADLEAEIRALQLESAGNRDN